MTDSVLPIRLYHRLSVYNVSVLVDIVLYG